MKKLLQSPKFWAITIGALLGTLLYYLFRDGEGLGNGFPTVLVTMYSAIALSDKANEIVKSYKK